MLNAITGSIRPGRVVLAAWLLMAVLVIVFAADIDRFAQAGESPATQALAQATPALSQAAQALGSTALRTSAAEAVQSLYTSAPLVGGGSAVPQVALQAAVAQARPQAQFSAPQDAAPSIAAQGGKVQRVLIIGDSFIEAQIGSKLEDILVKQYGLTVQRYGQRSTGLARPDYFNWPKKVAEMKAAFQPDLIIGSWGANDCQALTDAQAKVLCKFDTKEWDTEYGRRVSAVVAEMVTGGCKGVVIGLPSMRSRSLETRMKHLNAVTEKSVTGGGAVYMAVWPMSVDNNGKYLSSITVGGQEKLLRMSDGVHFSGPGAEYVAQKLCTTMAATYGWVKK